MSALLFINELDWVMRKSVGGRKRGIRWTLTEQIEDLDYADDLSLLSHTGRDMKEKTNRLRDYAEQVGLKINAKKTKLMTIQTDRDINLELNNEKIEKVEKFTYLGAVLTRDGGSREDIIMRIRKANAKFVQLDKLWKSRTIR